MKKNSHKKTVERPCLECRLAFRLSAKEKQEIEAKAKLCAMSPSRYIRRCVVGHSPKLHLTEQETEASSVWLMLVAILYTSRMPLVAKARKNYCATFVMQTS